MKILLDENLDVRLKKGFETIHEAFTMRDMKWLGKKNGDLFGLMVIYGFDVLITLDRNLQYQRNVNQFPLSIVVLKSFSNTYATFYPLIQALPLRLEKTPLEKNIVIEFPLGSR